MDYKIVMDGEEFNLKTYTIGIAEEVEAIEVKNNGSGKFREKLKAMYDFVTKVADGASDYLGEFKDCDPNKINLMYLRIIRSYNSPVEEYEKEQTEAQLSDGRVEKVIQMLDVLSKVDINNNK